MTWNHRIVEKTFTLLGKDEKYYEIHEAYYNRAGGLCGLTENPSTPHGESLDDLKLGLELMMTAFKFPVLIESEIEYASWDDVSPSSEAPCPKCGAVLEGDWSQCEGACPFLVSPHYKEELS